MDKDFFFNILYEAVESGINISIDKSKDKESQFQFSSRFFDYDIEKNEILIDLPSSQDEDILRNNDEIEVFFSTKGFRLGFFSKVKGFSEFKLSGEEIVPAIIIEMPEEGLDLQRRRDFRIQTLPPLEVHIKGIIRYDEPEAMEDISIHCICDNISRSGIALIENAEMKKSLKTEKNDLLDMNINIEGQIIMMTGRWQSRRELYEGKKIIIGLDFVEDKPNKIDYKKNIRIIMKYIMKRQRETMLKS